jgi:hypothetical protein
MTRELSIPNPLRWITDASYAWGVSSEHYVARQLLTDRHAPASVIRTIPDGRWSCVVCGLQLRRQWTKRTLDAFAEIGMYASVLRQPARRLAQDRLRQDNLQYISVPTPTRLVALSTGPVDTASEPVEPNSRIGITEKVFGLKNAGRIGRSAGFAPPVTPQVLWEGWKKGTNRSCGCTHSDRNEAIQCGRNVGLREDGDTTDWFARKCSEWRLDAHLAGAHPDAIEDAFDALDVTFTQCGFGTDVVYFFQALDAQTSGRFLSMLGLDPDLLLTDTPTIDQARRSS